MLSLVYACAVTIMINATKFSWNNRDLEVKKQVSERCPIYYPKSPCLKRFTKTGEHDYNVICGPKEWRNE